MAQLLLISAFTKLDSNNIGDIVDIFDDEHEFSPAEIAGFTILRVKETLKEVAAEMLKVYPIGIATTDDTKTITYPYTILDTKKLEIINNVKCNIELRTAG